MDPAAHCWVGLPGLFMKDGYSWLTARSYLRAAHHLGHFLRSEGIALVAVQPDTIDVFRHHLDDCRCPKPRGRKTEDTVRGAKCFLRHLWVAGVVAQPVKQPWPPLVQGFRDWLIRHRGVSETTLSDIVLPPSNSSARRSWATIPASMTPSAFVPS